MKRRNFLRHTACLAASSAAFTALSAKFNLAHAANRVLLGGEEYRALVCVFLYGGNDSFNMVVPYDQSPYNTYAATRGSVAVPRNQLLTLTPTANGAAYGLHPAMPELRALFNQANSPLAMVANVGPLLHPITKAQYDAGSVATPPQLFSHEDQSTYWSTPTANTIDRNGWGGLLADEFTGQNQNQTLAMTISTDGENVFQAGNNVVPYFLPPWGVETIGAITPSWSEPTNRRNAFNQLLAGPLDHPLERAYRDGFNRTVSNYTQMQAALSSAAVTQYETTFNNLFAPGGAEVDYLGNQLRMIARVIAARSVLQMTRQVFFVGIGGFDNHADLLTAHPTLLSSISRNLNAFYYALGAMNVQNNVVTFTASEFGRTLSNNGEGTDHGWGGHHLVLGGGALTGGPVRGGRFYGLFPSLAASASNPDDAGWGQIIPTTSVDQYAWTLARWYGLPDGAAGRDLIFPNATRFTDRTPSGTGQPHLGFLG
ncbi:MAG: DUF1501 domain-containing protein [Ahniella sp.]|nr:DUF1501 domain-containing protein [Ahniella sp.]